eukprot:UN15655
MSRQVSSDIPESELTPNMSLVDVVELLERKVNRIQEAKEKYAQKQRGSAKKRRRKRSFQSPNSTPPARSESIQGDQNCIIA